MSTNRCMGFRVPMLLALVVVILVAVPGEVAFGMHPSEDPLGESRCDSSVPGYIAELPDGERWECRYDRDLDLWYWDPLPPRLPGQDVNPADAVAYKTTNVTNADGVTHRITARTEWINNVLYSGTDVYLRKPITSPLSQPANWVGVWTRVYAWDGTSWSMCRQSDDWAFSSAEGDHFGRTSNWGTAPCGSKWYAAVSWVERWHPETSTWVLENSGRPVDTADGGVNLGAAQNGQVWDPAPGDEGKKPPKPAKEGKLKEKLKKEKAPTPSAPVPPPPTDGSA